MANLLGGYRHYAGRAGSKMIAVGADGAIFNWTSLQDAVDAAENNACIEIEPGTYTLTTTLSITKPLTLKGMGAPNTTVITSALATRTIMLQNPASGPAAATFNYFENVELANSSTGDAIEIDNDGGLAQAMAVKFDDCTINSSGGGVGIDLDQTSALAMYIYVSGQKAFHTLGVSTLDLTQAGSYVAIENMMISGALAYSATNVAYIITLDNCNVVSAAATTGGSASALLNYKACTTMATPWGGVAALSVAGDFDAAAGTETVI